MTNKQPQRYEIGMVGLGVMGRNLVLNMADNGFSVGGYDRDQNQVEALRREKDERNIFTAAAIPEFVSKLRRPRRGRFGR
jgi:6-phosphogluconate dehydrogenase